jgi:hypothetical protein
MPACGDGDYSGAYRLPHLYVNRGITNNYQAARSRFDIIDPSSTAERETHQIQSLFPILSEEESPDGLIPTACGHRYPDTGIHDSLHGLADGTTNLAIVRGHSAIQVTENKTVHQLSLSLP